MNKTSSLASPINGRGQRQQPDRARSRLARRAIGRMVAGTLLTIFGFLPCSAAQEIGPLYPDTGLALPADWHVASPIDIANSIGLWAQDRSIPLAARDELNRQLQLLRASPELPPGGSRLDLGLQLLAIADDRINPLRRDWELPRTNTAVPAVAGALEAFADDELVLNHLKLLMGRWLVQNEFHDEALAILSDLSTDDVLDRESLLFYRAVAQHQLLDQAACLATIGRLLQCQSEIPDRFAQLAQRMAADLKPLEPDSLDEISRLMGDIGRRTRLNRSGEKVLDQEQTVIRKLDKLISQLEEKQQQAPTAGPTSGGASPMQESSQLADKGDGQVPSKLQLDGGQWGNLPPSKRAAALAEMAKSMPPHYRAAIEEYFRRLAAEDQR